MSAPTTEGGHDYDDILGFPGDDFQDKDVVESEETSEPDVESADAEMNETTPSFGPSSVKTMQVLWFLVMTLWKIVSRH